MGKETRDTIICGLIAFLIVGGLIGGFLYAVRIGFDNDRQEIHETIRSHIVLDKPFNDVVGVSSNFISGAEGWYFVSILVTTDEYHDPQWIYDFRYDWNTDTLYYDDDIEGIGIINYEIR